MARGFLSGVIWGIVVSSAGVAALSLSSPLPQNAPMAAPEDAEVDSAALAPEPEAAPAEAMPDMAPEAGEPDPEAGPEPEAADPATEDTQPLVATEPDADPVPDPEPDLSEPGRRPQPEATIDRPDAPDSPPAAPGDRAEVAADTAPLAPPAVGEAPEAPEGATPDPAGATVAVGSEAPVAPGRQVPAPGAPEPETQPVIVTGPAQPPAPSVPRGDSALSTPLPDETPDPQTGTRPPEPEDPADDPEVQTAAPTAPAIGRPAVSLVDRAPAPEEPTPEPPAEADTGPLAQLPPDSPLVRYAARVDAPADVPRMAIVLIDDGSGPLGPQALTAFPFPVSFAIAPSHPEAEEAARGYRDLGFEVLVLGEVPQGAQASDVEVTMEGLLRAVPEAVAVLEDPDGSLQESRAVASQVAAVLADSGHGLVTQPNGLNTAQRLALRDGVPSATLFRDFDGDGQDTAAIRRTLDQAAFRARQEEGGVIMMGRLRADTISALVLWGLQDRSGTIALVPVSTVLAGAVAETQ